MEELQKLTQKSGGAMFGRGDMPSDIQEKYAAVVIDGASVHGLFDISTPDKFRESVAEITNSGGEYPQEIIKVAKEMVNLIFMTKYGSPLPLFIDLGYNDHNVIQSNKINFTKPVDSNRTGYMFNGKLLPLDSKVNIKAACEFFKRNEMAFPGKDRVKFATAIMVEANKHNIKANEVVEKYAADQINPNVIDLIDLRIKYAESYPETLSALEVLKKNIGNGRMSAEKIADALATTDTMPPFCYKFLKTNIIGSSMPAMVSNMNIPDGYASVFVKVAKKVTFADKVKALPNEKLAEYFTPPFIENLRSNTERVLENMPETMKDIIKRLVGE